MLTSILCHLCGSFLLLSVCSCHSLEIHKMNKFCAFFSLWAHTQRIVFVNVYTNSDPRHIVIVAEIYVLRL